MLLVVRIWEEVTFKPCFEEWVGFGHVEIGQIVYRERPFWARGRGSQRNGGKELGKKESVPDGEEP